MMLKNKKAPGEDGITNEVIKSAVPTLLPAIADMFNKIMQGEPIPLEWSQADIILIYKKGDPSDLANYRPISLISVFSKLFSKILQAKIKTRFEETQPLEQTGFRGGFSTIDNLQAVNQLIEKYKEYKFDVYIGLIDYEKAFNAIKHDFMCNSLEEAGINRVVVNKIKELYSMSEARIILEEPGKRFKLEKGVKQGEALSSDLFIRAAEEVFRKVDWSNWGLTIDGKVLTHLRFADDVLIS